MMHVSLLCSSGRAVRRSVTNTVTSHAAEAIQPVLKCATTDHAWCSHGMVETQVEDLLLALECASFWTKDTVQVWEAKV